MQPPARSESGAITPDEVYAGHDRRIRSRWRSPRRITSPSTAIVTLIARASGPRRRAARSASQRLGRTLPVRTCSGYKSRYPRARREPGGATRASQQGALVEQAHIDSNLSKGDRTLRDGPPAVRRWDLEGRTRAQDG
jgi:hypothetical protein